MKDPNFHPIEALQLGSQLCFPIYACARKITTAYTPLLKPLGLTYTQYITMMVLWEEQEITVHDLCGRLYLDSGTLSPVLKKLEHVPEALACQINRKKAVITPKEAERMKKELYRIIDALNE